MSLVRRVLQFVTGTTAITALAAAASVMLVLTTGASAVAPSAVSAVIAPGPTTKLWVSGPGTVTAGTPATYKVYALDAQGEITPAYRGTVVLSTTDAAAVLPAASTFTAADNGVRSFSVVLKTAGSRTIKATDTAKATITGAKAVTVSAATSAAGPATKLTVGMATSPVSGAPVDATVTALDAAGRVATGYRGTVAVTSSDPGAMVPRTYTFTASDNGVHRFPVVVAAARQGTVAVTDATTPTLTATATYTATPGALASFTVVAPPSGAVGIDFPVTVVARDMAGNVATGYRGTIDFGDCLELEHGQHCTAPDSPIRYTFTAADKGVHVFFESTDWYQQPYQYVAVDTANRTLYGATIDATQGWMPNAMAGWGDNAFGQVGYPTPFAYVGRPAAVSHLSWRDVAAGDDFTVGIDHDNEMWSWGRNGGRLGDGTTTDRPLPVRVLIPPGVAPRTWTTVAAGGSNAAAIATDGTLWTWGSNESGQLGDGTLTARTSPTQVGTATWKRVEVGAGFMVGLRTDGTLWAWGRGASGQTGLGQTGQVSVPTQIGTASDWTTISAGETHTLALRADRSLWVWGANERGQLGDGTTVARTAPVSLPGNDWDAVAAGGGYSLAVRNRAYVDEPDFDMGGYLWSWGDNSRGQLGDGTTTSRRTPAQVGAGPDYWSVAASWRAGAAASSRLIATSHPGSHLIYTWGDAQTATNTPRGSSPTVTWSSGVQRIDGGTDHLVARLGWEW